MIATQREAIASYESKTSSARGWQVVAGQEIRELWFMTWRGPILILAFSLLLSVLTYLAASNTELNILDQKDTVKLVLQVTLGIGIAMSLLLSADAISGERERGTLETLLLTPLPPRNLAIGKWLAVLSIWPVVMIIAIPYLWVLKAGTGVTTDAILSGVLIGTLLAITFASLGIIVSALSSSNRASLATSFFIFVALLIPTQLPGVKLQGWFGNIFLRTNPVTSGSNFIDRIVVNNHSWGQETSLLIAPILAAIVMTALAFLLTRRLQLSGGMGK